MIRESLESSVPKYGAGLLTGRNIARPELPDTPYNKPKILLKNIVAVPEFSECFVQAVVP